MAETAPALTRRLSSLLRSAARGVACGLSGWSAARRIPRVVVGAPALAPACQALLRALRDDFSAEERTVMDGLERRRASVLAETELVEVPPRPAQDLAGAPDPRGRISPAAASVWAKSPFWCRYLFALARQLRPATILELGTNVGMAASYLASAQRMGGCGRLVTIEAVPSLASSAERHLRRLGVDAEVVVGFFSEVLAPTLDRLPAVDLVFVDGHHDGPATLRYFEQLRPHLAPGAVVVFDDISWSAGMAAAWSELRRSDAFSAALDLRVLGVCLGGSAPLAYARIPIYGR